MNTLPMYAPVVLRVGLAAVFAFFGVSQLMDPASWSGLVPSWASSLSGLDGSMIVQMNGVFEIVGAAMLVLGIYVRIAAVLLAGHLYVIAQSIGFNDVGVRDFGLATATLALALVGDHAYCLVPMTRAKASARESAV